MSFVGPRDVLEIDLSTRSVRRITLDGAMLAATLGGVGLGVALIERHCERYEILAHHDALAPSTPLVFAAGPFAATPVPAGNKHAVATISPLTGLLTEGLSSSHWSAALRRCGLAALIVHGAAPEWTTLVIEGGEVRFEDARELLGTSAREATRALRGSYGDRALRVCAIGAAGENGIAFAALENDGRQAGRGGAGAVMGSKRLKAIVLRGRGAVPIADDAAARRLALRLRERTLGPKTAKYRILGTGANMRVLARMGQLPTRNFTAAIFPGVERVTPERAREDQRAYVELRAGCAGCPVQCEHMYVRRDRDPRRAAASEYESVWAFGPNCWVDDLDAVLDAIDACDRFGLDTISTGGVIAFAMECVENGLIAEDAVGPPLRFGNAAALLPAIESIVQQRGIGKTLARGVREAARRIGRGAADFAMHVKGLELPGYEPRALPTYALGIAVCTRGACHNRAATYDGDLRDPAGELDDEARVRRAIDGEDYAAVWDSLVLCKFIRDCFDDFYGEAAELYTAVTGLETDGAAMRASAQATWETKRRINARLGWTPADDTLPPRLFDPIADGPLAGMRVEPERLELVRRRYEDARRGVPA